MKNKWKTVGLAMLLSASALAQERFPIHQQRLKTDLDKRIEKHYETHPEARAIAVTQDSIIDISPYFNNTNGEHHKEVPLQVKQLFEQYNTVAFSHLSSTPKNEEITLTPEYIQRNVALEQLANNSKTKIIQHIAKKGINGIESYQTERSKKGEKILKKHKELKENHINITDHNTVLNATQEPTEIDKKIFNYIKQFDNERGG